MTQPQGLTQDQIDKGETDQVEYFNQDSQNSDENELIQKIAEIHIFGAENNLTCLPEMATSQSTSSDQNHVHLNGRTLEGGGQLVRIAIGLSALTGRPVSIDHVRGNRAGKKGLKRSHAAAVQLLAEISGSKVSGVEVGSQFLNFFPRTTRSKSEPLIDSSQVNVRSEYNIHLTTAGSISLIFQAIYPYLLHIGSQAATSFLKVNITGGTNTTCSPSFDYMSQVIAPNFAILGLPPLSIILHKRGWSSGPIEIGAVTFLIHPLGYQQNSEGKVQSKGSPSRSQRPETLPRFPRINLMNYERGKVTKVDITVLAPDYPSLNADIEEGSERGIRQFIIQTIQHTLRREMRKLDPATFLKRSSSSPSEEDTPEKSLSDDTPVHIGARSEASHHRTHVYILLVAQTSSGFRIGHDILGSLEGDRSKAKGKGKKKQQVAPQHYQDELSFSQAANLVDRCVEGFIGEILNESSNRNSDQGPGVTRKRCCLDQYMRDQIVVFEALGRMCDVDGHETRPRESQDLEDERDWTLHTKTAQWVCRQMLDA